MADSSLMDQTFHYVLSTMVERGFAPHYTEVARALSVPPEEGKKVLHELMGTGIPCWFHPGTDFIASFAPLNNLPTQYRITVEGRQKWFAQCGFEALAVCWLFPGRTVTVEAPCLDCGEPVRLDVRDGAIEKAAPAGIYGYIDVPVKDWRKNLPYS